MHNWHSDEEVDWRGISEAAVYIGTFLRKWGRVGVSDMKEKYGTVRVYCSLGWSSLLSITHPGWCHYAWYPKWLVHADIYHLSRIVGKLNYIVVPYHKWLYTKAYGRALKKWPHLREEILSGADHHRLLTKYGSHLVRTSNNCYTIYHDWHPDNYSVRNPREEIPEPISKEPIQWVKRSYE